MHCYPHFLGRKIPGTNTGVLFIYIWFQKNYGHANMYLSCTKYSCTVTHSFQVERFLPPVLAYYIWFQTRLLIFRQILVMHSIHMKCDLFFQAERVLPPILAYLFIYIYIWYQKNYGNAHMYQSCTKHTCTVIGWFSVDRFLPPIKADYVNIYIYMVPKELWKCQYVLVMY